MIRRSTMFLILGAASGLTIAASSAALDHPVMSSAAQSQPSGWTLPPDAAEKKSPLAVDDKVLAQGKAVFKDKCERCHGPAGVGDGPDADPDAQEDMDLTRAERASRNADGVVYFKVWNGRRRPKMPAFKDELSEQQVWQVVAYVQTLRKK